MFVEARIEELECQVWVKGTEAGTPGLPTTPVGKAEGTKGINLNRLTHYKNKQGDVSSSLAWDGLIGMKLDAGMVVEARSKEVTYLRGKRVFDKVMRSQAVRSQWNIIQTRWIHINKGDYTSPVFRSRLVRK